MVADSHVGWTRARLLRPALAVLVLASLSITLLYTDYALLAAPPRVHHGVSMLSEAADVALQRARAFVTAATSENATHARSVEPRTHTTEPPTAAPTTATPEVTTEAPTSTPRPTLATTHLPSTQRMVDTPMPTPSATTTMAPSSTVDTPSPTPLLTTTATQAETTTTTAPSPTVRTIPASELVAITSTSKETSAWISASTRNETTPTVSAPVSTTPEPPISTTAAPPTTTTAQAIVDPMFSSVRLYPQGAKTHNPEFIQRGLDFDATVARERGLIMCLHDGAVAMGLSLIKELRCLGNRELIQVYHCLPADLSVANQQLLLSEDDRLEVIDVCSDLVRAGALSAMQALKFMNWWVKPLAMHHTDLQEPILMDADDIFLRDPSVLRDSDGYKHKGTLFFYDRVIDERSYFRTRLYERDSKQLLQHLVATMDYAAFGLDGPAPSPQLLASFAYQDRTCHEMDSSLVAIDKRHAGKALDVLWWLITQLRHTVEYSWGDKEAFWLAFELAHVDYAFSPWGVSVVSSAPNRDLANHHDTLCGSIAQYLPTPETVAPELLYVNGRALLDPLAQGATNLRATANLLYNQNVTHATPRQPRTPRRSVSLASGRLASTFPNECLVGLGASPLPAHFQELLFRRRLHYLAITSHVRAPLAQC